MAPERLAGGVGSIRPAAPRPRRVRRVVHRRGVRPRRLCRPEASEPRHRRQPRLVTGRPAPVLRCDPAPSAGGGSVNLYTGSEEAERGTRTGAVLLDQVEAMLARFVAFPSDEARIAVTLW